MRRCSFRNELAAVVASVLLVLGLAGPASAFTVYAHGGSHGTNGISPDSTASQVNAYDHGACAESDARITSDHRFVQMHDSQAWHTTNAPVGFMVEEHTYAELRQYHLDDGQPIPTLIKSMRVAKHHHGCVLMELKSPAWTAEDLRYLQRKAVHFGLVNRFRLYLAWSPLVERARDNAPRLDVIWKMKTDTDLQRIKDYEVFGVVPRWGGIYKNNVTRIHRIGVRVFAPVSGPERWDKIERAGANGLLTNSPIRAVRHFS